MENREAEEAVMPEVRCPKCGEGFMDESDEARYHALTCPEEPQKIVLMDAPGPKILHVTDSGYVIAELCPKDRELLEQIVRDVAYLRNQEHRGKAVE